MRHRNSVSKLNRPADQRKAMVRNLLTSLFDKGALKTTDARARVLKAEAEKLILGLKDKNDMNAIRDLKSVVFTKESSIKALEYAKNLKRSSGFVRNTKVGLRAGDNAIMVQVELLTD